ncbi:hypothetical protein B0J12DRAFT_692198 [Macrophomina phaseolina]|uniref:Rhodopsin domain-containing protein n=1 Tax=Macrophomina phaseolina TaxID=35725 RepID=A0ABQ8FPL1_9PEZI|nr:hypothetical protein B0J12DRAFT_692198 [Macrophomina phaseolina]
MHFTPTTRSETVGAIPPPPGVSPNFDHPENKSSEVFIINILLPIIATLILLLRLYTRRFIVHNVGAEDYAIIFAGLLAWGFTVAMFFCIRYGLGVHMWDIPLSKYLHFRKAVVPIPPLWGVAMMSAKVSILCFYSRFSTNRSKAFIFIMMVIVIVYSLPASFLLLYACRPIAKLWDSTITYGSCINYFPLAVVYATANVFTDLALLVTPLFFFRKLRLPRRQKIGLIFIFMTGGLASAGSIARLKTAVEPSPLDMTWYHNSNFFWMIVEIYSSIIAACLPHIKPFLRQHFPELLGSTLYLSSGTAEFTLRWSQNRTLQSHNVYKSQTDIRIERLDDEIPLEPRTNEVKDSNDEVSRREGSTFSTHTLNQVV